MKKGLLEWVLVTGFLVLAAAGAIALFGDELREALGLRGGPSPPSLRAAPPVVP